MKAFVFPGQGVQYPGMGKELYEQYAEAGALFARADELLGFSLTQIMFEGSVEELRQTKVTQPAVFVHAYVACQCKMEGPPAMVAGHSLGEFTALAVNGTLRFEDALWLVSQRAYAMQRACERTPSGMAVVFNTDTALIEQICAEITEETVMLTNYNSPQQVVISGSLRGLEIAEERLRKAGARRILPLNVGGAFHSPLMAPAQQELATAIQQCTFHTPTCPIYQNSTARASIDPEEIQENLLKQMTSPVLWTQSVQNMAADGATEFIEYGPGETLHNLIKRILPAK